MIDAMYIFTKGGIVLWSKEFAKIKVDLGRTVDGSSITSTSNAVNNNAHPLNKLIRTVLLEERSGESYYQIEPYSFKWKLKNDLEIFFVAIYQGILQFAYLENLLKFCANEFINSDLFKLGGKFFDGGMEVLRKPYDEFTRIFQKILEKCDAMAMESRGPRQMRTFEQTQKGIQ